MSKVTKMKYIEKNEKILGGAPVITGTRIPVERLAHLIKQGYEEKNIKEEFPGVEVKVIKGAMSELAIAGLHNL